MDASQKPPEPIRLLFRSMQKYTLQQLNNAHEIIDFESLTGQQIARLVKHDGFNQDKLESVLAEFLEQPLDHNNKQDFRSDGSIWPLFEFIDLPGLFIAPSLLPHSVQTAMLDNLLHRDLSIPVHLTNVHLHYEVPYADGSADENMQLKSSFFSLNPETIIYPKDPSIHKPLALKQVLEKKLRWITLGGQYDWTEKTYPPGPPPPFPPDIGRLLHKLFPEITPESAIVNFYAPGDTLSVHRDVSEDCDRALVSISIGCDAVFLVSNEDASQTVAIRLRSGDVVLMTGPSRFAWHAVPNVIAETCPEELRDWPATATSDAAYESYRGWMSNRRINLNVRQMFA